MYVQANCVVCDRPALCIVENDDCFCETCFSAVVPDVPEDDIDPDFDYSDTEYDYPAFDYGDDSYDNYGEY